MAQPRTGHKQDQPKNPPTDVALAPSHYVRLVAEIAHADSVATSNQAIRTMLVDAGARHAGVAVPPSSTPHRQSDGPIPPDAFIVCGWKVHLLTNSETKLLHCLWNDGKMGYLSIADIFNQVYGTKKRSLTTQERGRIERHRKTLKEKLHTQCKCKVEINAKGEHWQLKIIEPFRIA